MHQRRAFAAFEQLGQCVHGCVGERLLAGRRVLITGGSSGIGLASARRLTEAGARVILLARGDAGLTDAARKLGGAATVTADVGASRVLIQPDKQGMLVSPKDPAAYADAVETLITKGLTEAQNEYHADPA